MNSQKYKEKPDNEIIQNKPTQTTELVSDTKPKRDISRYIVLGITVLGIIFIGVLIARVTNTISDTINSRRKVNRTLEADSSAVEIAKIQGYTIDHFTLNITDEKAFKNKNGNYFENAEDYPWYDKKNEIKHITIQDPNPETDSSRENPFITVPKNAFSDFESLQTVTLSEFVSNIEEKAFYNCNSLVKVTLPNASALDKIGNSAFEGCSNLSVISGHTQKSTFDPILTHIGNRAFAGCESLKDFKIPDDTTPANDAFADHGEEFAIVCTEGSKAHEYAVKNSFNVKETFDVGIVREEYQEELKSREEESVNSDADSSSQPEYGVRGQSDGVLTSDGLAEPQVTILE